MRRAPAPRSRDGDAEQRILDAAHAVFVRRGTAGARMQEIAAEAHVNQALLHYYFRSKERLARAAFERAGSQLMPAVIRVVASDEALEEKVAHVIALELDHLSRAPYLPGYIIGEVAHHPERAQQLIAAMTHGLTPEDIRPRVFGALKRQIDQRVAAGAMRRIAPESALRSAGRTNRANESPVRIKRALPPTRSSSPRALADSSEVSVGS